MLALLRAAEKQGVEGKQLEKMRAAMKAGRELTGAEVATVQRIIRQLDADERVFRSISRPAKAEAEAGAAWKASQGIEEEAIKKGQLAAYTFEHGGHTWDILKDGRVVRCSLWCTPSSLEEAFGDVIKRHPHLTDAMTKLKKLEGTAAAEAATNLGGRIVQTLRAERMSLKDLEKLLDNPEFAKGTLIGNDLRFVRYQKGGGKLGFEEWERSATQMWGNTGRGTLTEKELEKAFDLGPKNDLTMVSQDSKIANFKPDHIEGYQTSIELGKQHHFKEIKDLADMSDTGNISAMLAYVEKTGGAQLTIYYKSNTYMSGPLRTTI